MSFKPIEESGKSDQILKDMFATYNGKIDSKPNSYEEIPNFVHNPTLTIENTMFKSMDILTNQHFGSNMLVKEEYLQIIDLVNAKN